MKFITDPSSNHSFPCSIVNGWRMMNAQKNIDKICPTWNTDIKLWMISPILICQQCLSRWISRVWLISAICFFWVVRTISSYRMKGWTSVDVPKQSKVARNLMTTILTFTRNLFVRNLACDPVDIVVEVAQIFLSLGWIDLRILRKTNFESTSKK